MPPKRAVVNTHVVPAPNLSHPSAAAVPRSLDLQRPHPASHHTFISSPFYPSTATKGKKGPPPLPRLAKNPIAVEVVQRKVLAWYDGVKEGRGMPWRKEVIVSDLTEAEKTQRGYEVWVSEIMLQQTQVATVIAYFNRWMDKFPTVASLANADIEDVNSVWAGLGYYSRASRLLAGAKTVMRDFKGVLPRTAAELEKIDGIGPYSAGAISSIAFSKRAAMVDGNVTRVLSRLTALHAPPTAKATTSFIWALADVLVPSPDSAISSGGPNKPGSWNQGVMELGATVCTPKNPKCEECPLSDDCLAYAEVRALKHHKPTSKDPKPLVDIEDLCELCEPLDIDADHSVTQYPMAKERKKVREEETAACILEWEPSKGPANGTRKVLLVKRPEKGLLAGLFEFPAIDLSPSADSTPATRRTQLQSLLSTLLVESIPTLKPGPPNSSIGSSGLAVHSISDLGAITQVYSHQTRLYHILRIVFSSPLLPALAPLSTKTAPSGLVQSLAGRAKWVNEDDVQGANIGGAVGKVWDVRQSGGVGAGKLSGRGKEVNEEGAQGKGGAKGKKAVVGKKREPQRTREDDDFIVGSDEEEERRVKKKPKPKAKREEVAEPEPVFVAKKKRRIVISEDEED